MDVARDSTVDVATDGGDSIVDVGTAARTVCGDGETTSFLYSLESLCMRCGEDGTTRFLTTRIPNFREVVLMAFECTHCDERNNEIQFAGAIQPKGCCYTLQVTPGELKVLNRQVVKSDTASIKIPELEFEIPPEAQRGTLSTVEGILLRAANELQSLQEERKKLDPHTAKAIEEFLEKLRSFAVGNSSFSFILDDPTGNSFIENPYAPASDSLLSIKYYERTYAQQEAMGFLPDPALASDDHLPEEPLTDAHGSVGSISVRRTIAAANDEKATAALCRYSAPEEVYTMPSTCGSCGTSSVARFFSTKIPYFREVIVMASSCDECGYRSSELKAGGEIPKKGKRIKVSVQGMDDLSRDVIKSDTASVSIPEIELDLTSGTLGGLVTTVEGLITQIGEKLSKVYGFSFGDSLDECKRHKWLDFHSRLNELLSLKKPWTLIIDDALAGSFISPAADSFEEDHKLVVDEYERTWEQDEELGLNDMDTSSADMAYNKSDV
ncbi:Zinc finger protein ZPR1 [Zostera marina]|uniref:Zinc finger protein ZPR1 n=1 Tax=Zostera marina TaxID=29655 RepID=A0A0K9NZS1_ZOSMR|nr:Zinc finger protein ZPR1 [Zostera marina]